MKNKKLITILAITFFNFAQASDGCVEMYRKAKKINSTGQGIAAVLPIMAGTVAGKIAENNQQSNKNLIKNLFAGTAIVSGVSALGLSAKKVKINKVLKPLEAAITGDIENKDFQKFSRDVIKLAKIDHGTDIYEQDIYVELINMNEEQVLCPLASSGNKLHRILLSKKEVVDILIKRILQNI